MTEEDVQLIENDADLVREQVENIIYASEVVQAKLTEIERNRTYFGKTIEGWSTYFNIQIEETADPVRIKIYCAQINERLNMAYLYKSKTKRFLTDFTCGYDKQNNE